MNLSKNSLDLAYKLLANVGTKNYYNHVADVHRIILAHSVGVYIKARQDELNKKEYDPATQNASLNQKP